MRWIYCRSCHNPIPADEAAIESEGRNPSDFLCACENRVSESANRAPAVFGDLKPYKNIIDGKVIDGRRAHKEFLKAHGVVENPDPPKEIAERLYNMKHGAKYG